MIIHHGRCPQALAWDIPNVPCECPPGWPRKKPMTQPSQPQAERVEPETPATLCGTCGHPESDHYPMCFHMPPNGQSLPQCRCEDFAAPAAPAPAQGEPHRHRFAGSPLTCACGQTLSQEIDRMCDDAEEAEGKAEAAPAAEPLPPRPTLTENARPATLTRWGCGIVAGKLPFVPLPDGYWTPWHIAEAELAQARAEAETWKHCANCHEPLLYPGHCASAAKEHETGQDFMIAQLIEMRDGYKQEAEQLRQEREAAWQMIEQCYSLEPRDLIEREAKTNGLKFGLVQAVFSLWKREPKVEAARATMEAREQAAFMAGYNAYGHLLERRFAERAYAAWQATQPPDAAPENK